MALTGATVIFHDYNPAQSHSLTLSPMMSRMTLVVWAAIRPLLTAVQEMTAPWSWVVRSLSTRVLVTRPLTLSTANPTGDTGTESFLQVREGVGSPPPLLQYSFRLEPSPRGAVLTPTSAPVSLVISGFVGLAVSQ